AAAKHAIRIATRLYLPGGRRGLSRQVLQPVGMEAAAVGVLLPEMPDLGEQVDVAVAVYVGGEHVVAAQALIEHDALGEAARAAVQVLPDVPARRRAHRQQRGVLLLGGE